LTLEPRGDNLKEVYFDECGMPSYFQVIPNFDNFPWRLAMKSELYCRFGQNEVFFAYKQLFPDMIRIGSVLRYDNSEEENYHGAAIDIYDLGKTWLKMWFDKRNPDSVGQAYFDSQEWQLINEDESFDAILMKDRRFIIKIFKKNDRQDMRHIIQVVP